MLEKLMNAYFENVLNLAEYQRSQKQARQSKTTFERQADGF